MPRGSGPPSRSSGGLFGRLSGQVKVKSAHVALTPRLAAQDLRGVSAFRSVGNAFEEIDGAFAGGRDHRRRNLPAQRRWSDRARPRCSWRRPTSANSCPRRSAAARRTAHAQSRPGRHRPQSSRADRLAQGRRHLHVAGRTHRAARSGGVRRDHPQCRSGPADRRRTRSRDRMELALGNGGLNVPLAEGEIAVAAGQASLEQRDRAGRARRSRGRCWPRSGRGSSMPS